MTFNGEEYLDIQGDIIRVEVENNDGAADSFRILMALKRQIDGTWSHIDDDRFNPWTNVRINAGFVDRSENIMDGYITQIRPRFDAVEAKSCLELFGLDATVKMNTEEKMLVWPDKKDSDIAEEIFRSYGFESEMETTPVIHEESRAVTIQRETDIQFLRRLAARNGFECFVSDNTGYFRKPDLTGSPQKVLALHFGEETNLISLNVEMNALLPTVVEMQQLDMPAKEVNRTLLDSTLQKKFGKLSSSELDRASIKQSKLCHKNTVAYSIQDMEVICQALYNESEWLLRVEGEIDSLLYDSVLKAHAPVILKGVGETYSGTYYVTAVHHTFTQNGYRQSFKAKRNALSPVGNEDWGSGGSLSGGPGL